MKGRRQARRAALQALYELDQSGHAPETVLAGRVAALADAALDSALPPRLRPLAHTLSAGWTGQALDEPTLRSLADSLAVPAADLAVVAAVLERVAPQADYLKRLVRGVLAHAAALDRTIQTIAPEWPVAQMAPVDRNVLRIALWEMASGASPTRVAINEAVELARAFSGEGARRMVNGALGAYASSGPKLALSSAAGPP
jgi:transcription antitermination factor NusB